MSVTRVPAINLARRPFRNNTIHYAVFATCIVLLTAASVYNVYDFVVTGGEISSVGQDLRERSDRYRGLGDEVEKMKSDVNKLDLTTLNTKSNFANGLIMSRLFSWSALFDRMEDLIPPDVKIRSIRPAISPKGIEIQIDGMARTPQALYEFETALDGSNYFTGVYPVSESTRESKTELNFDLMMNYIPGGRIPTKPGAPATPTAGLPPAPGQTGAESQAAPAGTDGATATVAATTGPNAPAATSPGPAGQPGSQPQPSPAGAQDANVDGTAAGTAAQESAAAPPAPAHKKPVQEMTNKEFLDAFGKERLIQARGRFGVRAPIEHPELNNAEFIQKFGMEAFLKARGHLDRAAQVVPTATPRTAAPPAGDPNAGAPK